MTEKREVPEGAVVIYPTEVVQHLFGHSTSNSTRREMSRHDVEYAKSGYLVEDVERILREREPGRNWPRTPRKQSEEKDNG